MPIDSVHNMRFDDLSWTPADRTSTIFESPLLMPPLVDTDVVLTKGHYVFHFSNAYDVTLRLPYEDRIEYIDGSGDFQSKRFAIGAITLVPNGTGWDMQAEVEIIDNPVWLVLVYVAISAALVSWGALSVGSVLTKIEAVIKETTEFVSKPAILIGVLAAAFLLISRTVK